MKESAIYIHIPFCDHKCIYCDFYSIISYENVKSYLGCIKKEIDFYAAKYSEGRKVISIYFGGGTPSFMEPTYISEIINHLKNSFDVLTNAEITLETNPGTVDEIKLKKFKEFGINRISIGIQSFDDNDLKFLTRIHNSQTAKEAVYLANQSGFENISIDLIFNLPGQTKEKWKNNLEQAVQLPIKHISAYSLILEKGTILNKMVLDGKVKLQDVDFDAELYSLTIDFLTQNGFIQYEVSNFTKKGFECIHNNAYWRYKDYLSFGTSAHSFVDGKRWWNFSSLNFYNEAVNIRGNAVIGDEVLTKNEMLNEYVMLALRSRGLNLSELKNNFGGVWIDKNHKLLGELKNSKFLFENGEFISLTPKGYSICDEIIKNFN